VDLAAENFIILRDLIKEKCGIWLSESKTNFLKIRLKNRLKVTNMDTIRNYYYYLKYDPNGEKEIEELIDAVTVNETYFFREQDQLNDFIQGVVPELMEQKQGINPLRIWSSASSTGEEAYTLAMLLLENSFKTRVSKFEILGSDISPSVLRSAREGRYDDYSTRHIPPLYMLKYFDKINGKYVLKPRAKEMVTFARVNLMDSFSTGRITNMDCVFCRNVLIYFDDKDKARCIENLYRSLNKGGYLLLGHAESLAHVFSPFEVVRINKSVVYKKQ